MVIQTATTGTRAMDDPRPYGRAWFASTRVGWPASHLGFPGQGPAKSPPPKHRTGKNGKDADPWVAWDISGVVGGCNIGIRIPAGVVGIDVDAYHGGLETLAEIAAVVGVPLPVTKMSTAPDGRFGHPVLPGAG